jgi:hypothetical protein
MSSWDAGTLKLSLGVKPEITNHWHESRQSLSARLRPVGVTVRDWHQRHRAGFTTRSDSEAARGDGGHRDGGGVTVTVATAPGDRGPAKSAFKFIVVTSHGASRQYVTVLQRLQSVRHGSL